MMSSKRDWRTQPSGPNKPVSVNPQGSATKIFLSTFLPRAQKKFEIPSLKISEVLDFKFLIQIQLFIYIFSWKFSCLFTLHLKFSCLFTFSIESSAVYLHFQSEIRPQKDVKSWFQKLDQENLLRILDTEDLILSYRKFRFGIENQKLGLKQILFFKASKSLST